jgi:hypothetical protein
MEYAESEITKLKKSYSELKKMFDDASGGLGKQGNGNGNGGGVEE